MQRQWQPGAETRGRPGHRRGRRPVADSRLSLQHGAATWRRMTSPAGRMSCDAFTAVPVVVVGRCLALLRWAKKPAGGWLLSWHRSGGARLLLPALQAHAGVGGRAPSLPCQLMDDWLRRR